MLNRALQLLLAGCLMTGTLWAAESPFVGKWKVNPSKSKLYDEMKVEVAGANKYATVTVRLTGQSKPQSILVYSRE
jgi:hypothetical protein